MGGPGRVDICGMSGRTKHTQEAFVRYNKKGPAEDPSCPIQLFLHPEVSMKHVHTCQLELDVAGIGDKRIPHLPWLFDFAMAGTDPDHMATRTGELISN